MECSWALQRYWDNLNGKGKGDYDQITAAGDHGQMPGKADYYYQAHDGEGKPSSTTSLPRHTHVVGSSRAMLERPLQALSKCGSGGFKRFQAPSNALEGQAARGRPYK